MRLTALELFRCPDCAHTLSPHHPHLLPLSSASDSSRDQIADGAAVCPYCAAWHPIESGLLELRPAALQSADRRARVAAMCGLDAAAHGGASQDRHKSEQERFFTEEAEGYERDVVRSPFYQALDDLTVHRWGASLPAGARVLDIGAGTGRVALPLAERGHYVVALDFTEALLRQAQRKAAAMGVVIDVVLADAEALPVVDAALDAIVAHGVLHHMTAPASVIGHAGRALREGGRWFSLDPHRSPARGVFDAAMRVVPLWKEEAAPDALQTEDKLLAWCRAAGISGTATYSCFVLPHLLMVLPRGVIRAILRATDALLQRSVLRSLAGVIHVAGIKSPDAPGPAPGAAPRQTRATLTRALILLVILGLARAWQVDGDVALNSSAYYMGGLEPTLAVANAPHQLGVWMVHPGGEPLENGFDDIGYALTLQVWSTVAGPVNGTDLARLHQILYAIAAFLLAWALSCRFQSTAVGVAVLVALLVLGHRLAMLIYGQVSNQTITSVFPLVFLSVLVWWSGLVADRQPRRVWLPAIGVGVLAGLIDLTRHSHGLAVLFTIATVLVFGPTGLRRRAQLASAFVVGFLLITMVAPAAVKLHRDVTLGRFDGWALAYLRKPPQHHIYYTLLTGVGRYPNSLGLRYEDRSVDSYITSHSDARGTALIVEAAQPLWSQYVREYPGEYARALLSGAFELPAFLAYTTFMAERRWTFAWPGIVGGIDVDPGDIARYGDRLLMNVRYRYLRLSWWQWAVFVGAWAAMLASAVIALRASTALRNERLLIASALVYLAWVALPRALIPVQGMDLVFAFWSVALLCGVSLWRAYPPPADYPR